MNKVAGILLLISVGVLGAAVAVFEDTQNPIGVEIFGVIYKLPKTYVYTAGKDGFIGPDSGIAFSDTVSIESGIWEKIQVEGRNKREECGITTVSFVSEEEVTSTYMYSSKSFVVFAGDNQNMAKDLLNLVCSAKSSNKASQAGTQ